MKHVEVLTMMMILVIDRDRRFDDDGDINNWPRQEKGHFFLMSSFHVHSTVAQMVTSLVGEDESSRIILQVIGPVVDNFSFICFLDRQMVNSTRGWDKIGRYSQIRNSCISASNNPQRKLKQLAVSLPLTDCSNKITAVSQATWLYR